MLYLWTRHRFMTQEQVEFSTFCIGNVAREMGISQQESYLLLLRSGVLYDYIVKSYDVLHTYSRQYIVEDIVSLLRERHFA